MVFSVDGHGERWQKLERTHRKGDPARTSALMAEYFPLFRASEDDLRLLFYIGFHCDEATYREALTYFTDWKTTPPARYDYRCNAYAYAVANTLPPKVQAAKPYILPLFCEVVGYVVP